MWSMRELQPTAQGHSCPPRPPLCPYDMHTRVCEFTEAAENCPPRRQGHHAAWWLPSLSDRAQGQALLRAARCTPPTARGRRWARPGALLGGGPSPCRQARSRPTITQGTRLSHPTPLAQGSPHSRALSGPWFRPAWASPWPVSTGELHLGPDSELWTRPTLSPSQETWLQAAGPLTPPSARLTNRKAGSRRTWPSLSPLEQRCWGSRLPTHWNPRPAPLLGPGWQPWESLAHQARPMGSLLAETGVHTLAQQADRPALPWGPGVTDRGGSAAGGQACLPQSPRDTHPSQDSVAGGWLWAPPRDCQGLKASAAGWGHQTLCLCVSTKPPTAPSPTF